jgi:hypothetical protein
MVTRGIPVETLRKAADPVTAPRVLVLRGQRSFEDEDNAWALNQVLRRLKAYIPTLELQDMALPSYRILANVSNDPDDTLFSPDDQFPLVFDALKQADIMIVASHQHHGFPSADIVRILERLADLAHARRDAGEFEPLLNKMAIAIITNGGLGAYPAALATAGAFSRFGCTLVRHGIAFWDGYEKGAMTKDKSFVLSLDRIANDISDLCAALKR